jgi:hypothetical protein
MLLPGDRPAASDTRVLVTGRIEHIENGKPVCCAQGLPTLLVYRVEDSQWLRTLALEADGDFYWLLPRGTYLIAQYSDRQSPPIELRVAFQATTEGTVVYAGTLRLDVSATRAWYLEVQDDFDQAGALLAARNPKLDWPIVNRVMVRDANFNPALPRAALVDALRAQKISVLTPAQ